MNREAAIRAALDKAGITATVASTRNLSGGCIHEVVELTLSDDRKLVVKIGPSSCRSVFEEEFRGLESIGRTETVPVAQPLAAACAGGAAVLLMTALDSTTAEPSMWQEFGEQLAAMHQFPVGDRYGFEIDNHLGPTQQINTWSDDWVAFNADHRLGFQLALAQRNRILTVDEGATVQRVIDRLDRFIPRRPRPSLLHGDLWSGNALPARVGSVSLIAVIDPAPYIGDGWADIAMMQLFGGFPAGCISAYRRMIGGTNDVEQRIAVYQLYHLLNHANIFGRGHYMGQVMHMVRRLLR